MKAKATIRSLAIAAVALGAFSLMSNDAKAQCGYGGGFGGGYGVGANYYGGGFGVSLNFGRPAYNYGYSNFARRPYYHDTTHIDYHPGRLVPHGNHYDYIRPHTSLHRTGHWHH